MGPGGVIAADIPALRQTVVDMGSISDDLLVLMEALGRLPSPTEQVYGWQGTADAMTGVITGWGAELDVFYRAVGELTAQLNAVIENLADADDRARRAGPWHGR